MGKGKKSEINKNAVNIGTKDTEPANVQEKQSKNRKNN